MQEDHTERGEPSQPLNKLKDETANDKESPKPKPRPVYNEVQFKDLHAEFKRESSIERRKSIAKMNFAIGESGIEAEEPITVGQLFKHAVENFSKHPALKYKEGGKWKAFTYTEYYDHCIRAAKSFLKVRVRNTVVFWEEKQISHSCIIIK